MELSDIARTFEWSLVEIDLRVHWTIDVSVSLLISKLDLGQQIKHSYIAIYGLKMVRNMVRVKKLKAQNANVSQQL